MSGFTVEFEFEIGQLVYFKDADHTSEKRPRQFTVIERYGQECHAGVQRHYRLNGIAELIPEVALVTEEPAYRTVSESMIRDDGFWQLLAKNRDD